jgi:hypothetical protein
MKAAGNYPSGFFLKENNLVTTAGGGVFAGLVFGLRNDGRGADSASL